MSLSKLQLSDQTYFIRTDVLQNPYIQITGFNEIVGTGLHSFFIDANNFVDLGSEIIFEIVDSRGNTVSISPIKDLLRGTSRVVSFSIDNEVSNGPATLYVATVLNEYIDNNASRQPVPNNFKEAHNLLVSKQFQIDKSLPNTDEIIFKKPPTLEVTSSIQPVKKVKTNTISNKSVSGKLQYKPKAASKQNPNFTNPSKTETFDLQFSDARTRTFRFASELGIDIPSLIDYDQNTGTTRFLIKDLAAVLPLTSDGAVIKNITSGSFEEMREALDTNRLDEVDELNMGRFLTKDTGSIPKIFPKTDFNTGEIDQNTVILEKSLSLEDFNSLKGIFPNGTTQATSSIVNYVMPTITFDVDYAGTIKNKTYNKSTAELELFIGDLSSKISNLANNARVIINTPSSLEIPDAILKVSSNINDVRIIVKNPNIELYSEQYLKNYFTGKISFDINSASKSSFISDELKTTSYANITIKDMATVSGDIKKIKIFSKSDALQTQYSLTDEFDVDSDNLLSDKDTGDTGNFNEINKLNFWNVSQLNDIEDEKYLYKYTLRDLNKEFNNIINITSKRSSNVYQIPNESILKYDISSSVLIVDETPQVTSSIYGLYTACDEQPAFGSGVTQPSSLNVYANFLNTDIDSELEILYQIKSANGNISSPQTINLSQYNGSCSLIATIQSSISAGDEVVFYTVNGHPIHGSNSRESCDSAFIGFAKSFYFTEKLLTNQNNVSLFIDNTKSTTQDQQQILSPTNAQQSTENIPDLYALTNSGELHNSIFVNNACYSLVEEIDANTFQNGGVRQDITNISGFDDCATCASASFIELTPEQCLIFNNLANTSATAFFSNASLQSGFISNAKSCNTNTSTNYIYFDAIPSGSQSALSFDNLLISLSTGSIAYSNFELTEPFNGGNLYYGISTAPYKLPDVSFKINSTGSIDEIFYCNPQNLSRTLTHDNKFLPFRLDVEVFESKSDSLIAQDSSFIYPLISQSNEITVTQTNPKYTAVVEDGVTVLDNSFNKIEVYAGADKLKPTTPQNPLPRRFNDYFIVNPDGSLTDLPSIPTIVTSSIGTEKYEIVAYSPTNTLNYIANPIYNESSVQFSELTGSISRPQESIEYIVSVQNAEIPQSTTVSQIIATSSIKEFDTGSFEYSGSFARSADMFLSNNTLLVNKIDKLTKETPSNPEFIRSTWQISQDNLTEPIVASVNVRNQRGVRSPKLIYLEAKIKSWIYKAIFSKAIYKI